LVVGISQGRAVNVTDTLCFTSFAQGGSSASHCNHTRKLLNSVEQSVAIFDDLIVPENKSPRAAGIFRRKEIELDRK
jgi:hypothetical protein